MRRPEHKDLREVVGDPIIGKVYLIQKDGNIYSGTCVGYTSHYVRLRDTYKISYYGVYMDPPVLLHVDPEYIAEFYRSRLRYAEVPKCYNKARKYLNV